MAKRLANIWADLKEFNKMLILILTPSILSPLIFIQDDVASYTFVLILMGVYWIFEVLPIPVTALLPMVLFPILGVMPTKSVSVEYLKDTNFLLLGGFIIATSFERSGLHKRIALNILNFVGPKPRFLLFGFMLSSWFLSMWISNTATTTIMMPMCDAVLKELTNSHDASRQNFDQTKVALTLSVPVAASIGGIATLTGSVTNLVLTGIIATVFPAAPAVSFFQWFLYCFPTSLLMFLSAYLYMHFYYFGWPKFTSEKTQGEIRTEKLIRHELEQLGDIIRDEVVMVILFSFTVLLWLLRDPGFIPGWAQYFKFTPADKPYVTDASVSVIMAFICFIIPSCDTYTKRPLLTWDYTQKKVPWGVLLLIGGGFALAEASDDQWSGFASFTAEKLKILEPLPVWLICLIVSSSSIFLTEITSNAATASFFNPILCQLSVALNINPFYLTVPATIGCNLAFMLPAAGPPQAIAFGYGYLRVIDMVKCGIMLNVIGIVLNNALINTFGYSYWDLGNFPDWANI